MHYVYIMSNKEGGALYIGFTSDLPKRIFEHKNNVVEGFTKRYGLHNLIYFEEADDIQSAIAREKQLKAWRRSWKIELIEKTNPHWRDLTEQL